MPLYDCFTFENQLEITADDLIGTPGLKGQVRIGCCKVSQFGGGLTWGDPKNAQFYNNGKYATLYTPPRGTCEDSYLVYGSQWLLLQDFKFTVPQDANIVGIVPAFRGHQNGIAFVESFNVAGVKGGVIFPQAQDFVNSCYGVTGYPIVSPYGLWVPIDMGLAGRAPNDAFSDAGFNLIDTVLAYELSYNSGSSVLCNPLTDGVRSFYTGSADKIRSSSYGRFYTTWAPDDINSKDFGIALRVSTGSVGISGGTFFLDCCGVGVYFT